MSRYVLRNAWGNVRMNRLHRLSLRSCAGRALAQAFRRCAKDRAMRRIVTSDLFSQAPAPKCSCHSDRKGPGPDEGAAMQNPSTMNLSTSK
jgi:hypothetical protein